MFCGSPRGPCWPRNLNIWRESRGLRGICLDYDAESANCETFANAVHGIWGKGVQVSDEIFRIRLTNLFFDFCILNCKCFLIQAPQGGVQKGVKLFNKTAKWTKRNQIPLVYQMWHRIRKEKKMLPTEQGPPYQPQWENLLLDQDV